MDIQIYEMFMRDGLQSLDKIYSLENKKFFIDCLISCNIKNIEFGSTTNPKLLPQMKESYELWDYLDQKKLDNNFIMLITNNNNLKKSIDHNISSFSLVCSVSDIFGMKNLLKNSLESFDYVIEQISYIYNNCISENIKIRVYLSCTFGTIDEDFNDSYMNKLQIYLLRLLEEIKKYNIHFNNFDIVLCDTYSVITDAILIKVLELTTSIDNLNKYISLHLHTNNDFNDLIDISLYYNINKFDSSILNIGGCPFSGKENFNNINTVNLIKYLENKNYKTNIDIDLLEKMEDKISKILYKTEYTFIYCTKHDDGYIIKSDEKYINCENIRCSGSELCAYNITGILSYDGNCIGTIKSVQTNFDIYGGGFEFKYFMQNLRDINDNYLNINDENILFRKWFEDTLKIL